MATARSGPVLGGRDAAAFSEKGESADRVPYFFNLVPGDLVAPATFDEFEVEEVQQLELGLRPFSFTGSRAGGAPLQCNLFVRVKDGEGKDIVFGSRFGESEELNAVLTETDSGVYLAVASDDPAE